MQSTGAIMILVKRKTVYLHFGEILKHGSMEITNSDGTIVFRDNITESHYEVVDINQPEGKYWINIDSDKIKTKKSFHLK